MREKKPAAQVNRTPRASLILKGVLVLLLAAFLFGVYRQSDAKDVSMDTIAEALQSRTDVGEFQSCDELELMKFIGIDANEYEGFLYYKSKEALGVDELLVLKAADGQELSTAQDAVDERIRSQIDTFDSYGPEQVKRLKNAIVTTRGRYLCYVVAEDPEAYEEVVLDVI